MFQCLLCTNCVSFFNPWANFIQQVIKSRVDHTQTICWIGNTYLLLLLTNEWHILMLASHEKLKCGDKLTLRQVSWSRCMYRRMFQRVWEPLDNVARIVVGSRISQEQLLFHGRLRTRWTSRRAKSEDVSPRKWIFPLIGDAFEKVETFPDDVEKSILRIC